MRYNDIWYEQVTFIEEVVLLFGIVVYHCQGCLSVHLAGIWTKFFWSFIPIPLLKGTSFKWIACVKVKFHYLCFIWNAKSPPHFHFYLYWWSSWSGWYWANIYGWYGADNLHPKIDLESIMYRSWIELKSSRTRAQINVCIPLTPLLTPPAPFSFPLPPFSSFPVIFPLPSHRSFLLPFLLLSPPLLSPPPPSQLFILTPSFQPLFLRPSFLTLLPNISSSSPVSPPTFSTHPFNTMATHQKWLEIF